MARANECAWCDGRLYAVTYDQYGEKFCSAACVDKYEREVAKYQLSLRLQPAIQEADACGCRRCTDDG